MTIGVWDPETFAAYRAAPDGPRKTFLANRLYVENEPLVKTLVAQMLGQGQRKGSHRIPAALRRENRAELVESWEDAMGIAGVAFAKALRDYDPAKGKIAFFLGMKIKYELQCLIERSTNVRTPRDAEQELVPRGFVREGGEEEVGFEELIHRRRVDHGESAEAVEFGEVAALPPAPPPPPPESALTDFIARRCRFGPPLRIPRITLFGAYERHARAHKFAAVPALLVDALRARSVRAIKVRFERWDNPEHGFAGVSLANEPNGRAEAA